MVTIHAGLRLWQILGVSAVITALILSYKFSGEVYFFANIIFWYNAIFDQGNKL